MFQMTEFEIEWPQLKMRTWRAPPADTSENSSKRIPRTHGVGLVLIQQLLFSQMPELFFFALGPTAIFPDLVGTLRFPSYWALPRNTPTRLPPAPRSSGPASRADRGVRNEHRRHIAALLALGRSVDDIHELYKTHVVSVERVLDKGTLPKRDGCLNDAPTHRAFGSKADTGLHPARVRSLQKRTCQLDRAVSVKGQPRTSLGRLGGPFLHPGSRIIFWLVVLAVRKP
jgi:hypothetical protein